MPEIDPIERDYNKKFLNPYNFINIPFNPGAGAGREESPLDTGTLTGELKCKIKTKTRVFVPESEPSHEDPNKHRYYAFMKDGSGKCMIPGSSIRGVLRNAYETATDSCFSTLKNSRYLSSRYNGGNILNPGLLIKEISDGKECWKLYSANEYLLLANIKDERYNDEDVWNKNTVDYSRIREHLIDSWKQNNITIDGLDILREHPSGYINKNLNDFYNDKKAIEAAGEKVFCETERLVYRNTIIRMKGSDNSLWIVNNVTIGARTITEKIQTGDCVYFRTFINERQIIPRVYRSMVSELRKKPTTGGRMLDGEREGYLVIGEQGDNTSSKHYCRVFAKVGAAIDIDKKYIDQVRSLINDYGDPKINKKLKGLKAGNRHRGYQYLLDKDVIPVMYEQIGGKYYFQLAAMGRRVYDKKLEDFADNIHKPCKKRENLCPACKLFGMIGKDGNNSSALGSRIRISDAKIITDQALSDDRNTWDRLSVLSNPHIYLPFFQNGVNAANKDDVFNENYEGAGISLKGRKFYLHMRDEDFFKLNPPRTGENQNEDNDSTDGEQNITAQTLGKNTEFEFSVFYENLTEEELRTLIRIITLGENKLDGKYCHKIGHGKPIGLGSAKFYIENVTKRSYDGATYSSSNANDDYLDDLNGTANTCLNDDYYNSLRVICDYNRITEFCTNNEINICYPGAGLEKGFEWFGDNSSAANQQENNDWQTLSSLNDIYNANADNDFDEKVLFDWIHD